MCDSSKEPDWLVNHKSEEQIQQYWKFEKLLKQKVFYSSFISEGIFGEYSKM